MIMPQVQQIITDIIVGKYPNVESIWLYGSRASEVKRYGFVPKQPPKENSDYDICVKMPDGCKVMRYDEALNDILHKAVGNEVHVIFSTKRNGWMEQQLWGFPTVTAMNKKDTSCVGL
jgi:predicted nucleotidyltransferase